MLNRGYFVNKGALWRWIQEVTNVGIQHPVHFLPYESYPERIQRLMLASPGTEPIREPQEVLFIDLVEDRDHCVLDDLVLQGCNAQGSLSSVRFGDEGSLGRLRSIRSLVYSTVQVLQSFIQVCFVLLPRDSVYSRRSISLQCVEAVQ